MDTLEKTENQAPEPDAQPDFGDAPGAPLRLALWKRGQALLHRLDQSRHELTDEHVHECRVASRRLQFCLEAVLEITGKKPGRKINREMRFVQKSLRRLRDLHVERDWLARHPELTEVSENLQAEEQELKPKAMRALREVSLKKLELRLEGLDVYLAGLTTDDESFEQALHALLDAVQRGLQEAVESVATLDSQDSQTYHPLRLLLKKFRYQAELLSELEPNAAIPVLDTGVWDHLKSLHQTLGSMQDVETLCRELDKFWSRTPPIRRVQHRILGLLLKERDRHMSRLTPEHLKLETLWTQSARVAEG